MENNKLGPKEWRKAKSLSIEKVASILDVSPTTWTKWEGTPSLIPIGKAEAFCRMIGVSPESVSFLP